MKIKTGVTFFLVVCFIVNVAALGKHYGFEDKETEAITKSIIPDVSKNLQQNYETPTIEPTTVKCISLGEFKLTAYCPCTECSGKWGDMTATGVRAKENHTIAVDPTVIPYGTEVIINGHTYVAEDCGSAVKGNVIDIYFDTHEEVDNFGVQYAKVFLYEN